MRTTNKIIAVCGGTLLAAVTATGYAAADAPAKDKMPTKPEIASLFTTWNKALATGDAKTVVALYTPKATLLPTLSDDNRTNRTEIADYFRKDFLPKKPNGVITESLITILDENTATRSGDYDFTVTDANGKRQVVPARFTFVYEKTNGRWLISTHHSSLQPTGH
jgi:uncharacterized protein (TIGR02246 family)